MNSLRKTLRRPVGRLLDRLDPVRAVRRALLGLGNWRRMRRRNLDYVLLSLPETLPALPETRGWLRQRILGTPPLSLWDLDRIFERIADDPRPKGVILRLRGLSLSLADLQTLHTSILRLRARGRRVVCFAQGFDMASYFIASACDAIVLQPGGELATIGLRSQALFLKDALDALGVTLDVVAISPYKGAFDQLSRAEMSPEGRAQLDWLLDSRFDQWVNTVAAARGLTPDAVRAMIDSAPHLDADALSAGYVDAVLNEEGLPAYLDVEHLVPWSQAGKRLLVKQKPRADRYVALLKVEGMMIPGESGGPPGGFPLPVPFIGGSRAGDLTVVRQVRSVMRDKRAAAVILYIDSGGGAAIAAEAMTAALDELAADRPLLAYMNSVAASGGYYVATAARRIIAQPGTITGSIGVVTAKPVTGALLTRLRFNAIELTRGANASYFSPNTPFSEGQRAKVRASIEHIYRQFVERVARGRGMTVEAVDAVGGGRVWTGAQALDLGLVDELGSLRDALAAARRLADLPDDAPLVVVEGRGKPLPPQLARAVDPAAALTHALDGLRAVGSATPLLLLPLHLDDA